MSENYSKKVKVVKPKNKNKYYLWLALPTWVLVGTFFSFYLTAQLFFILKKFGLTFSFLNGSVKQLVGQALAYIVAMLLVIVIPYLIFKHKINWQLLGLKSKFKWKYILLAIGSFGLYYLISIFLMFVMMVINPNFDISQKQETGFESLHHSVDYVMAFLALVVAAPIVEEVLFRGFLFGALKKSYRFWVATLITSVTFGLAHGAWNVGVDTFALSLVLCYLRYNYNSLYPAIFLHMLKNGLAYYILFIVKPF